MKRVAPVILLAAGVLVALDIVGALAERPLGFPYSPLGAVSVLVYFSVGVLGSLRSGLIGGTLAAAVVGFLDGTLGPLAAWLVGPGPVGQTLTEPRIFAYGIAVVTGAAIAAGLLGSVGGTWVERRRGLRSTPTVVSR
jgi:hypothetical protein